MTYLLTSNWFTRNGTGLCIGAEFKLSNKRKYDYPGPFLRLRFHIAFLRYFFYCFKVNGTDKKQISNTKDTAMYICKQKIQNYITLILYEC